ncbi:hypothetical protein J2S13_001281 [Oikeobacillus pervagus]|uniref:DUF4025 domain-containing protein n=1 Tax=Oikeobacillus pervagus TaxID=1325931 RepID=A0AAJ1T2T4_9BACI|nr:YozQ family protein [Oikeobacillus pervagus]MDQ0214884.1 hypothetical protein [Oikeobacillus pervagus]
MIQNKESFQTDQLAGRHYDPEDYTNDNELASGLAATHEQVSDTLMEGTIDNKMKNLNDEESEKILRKG